MSQVPQKPPTGDRGWAPYMRWAKEHPAARFDLAGSNLLPVVLDELPGAREALTLTGHNDDGYGPLVAAIAAHHRVAEERVATATGTSGANFLVMAALLRPGDEVLVEAPGYDPLAGAARLLGARVLPFERPFEESFRVDPERVAAALTAKTRLVILTRPHNPSGAVVPDEVLAEVGRLAARVGARVLVDEVYREALFEAAPEPAALLGEVFISTSSLTKAYGLAGLRCGWALASPEVAAGIRRARDVVDGTGALPTEALAVLAFEQLDLLRRRARGIIEPNFARLAAFIEARPELVWARPPGGTLAFPRLLAPPGSHGEGATPFAAELARRWETAVVPGHFFGAPAHLRLACGGRAEILARGLEALGAALDEAAAR